MNILEVVIGPYPEVRGGVDKMVSLLVAGLRARGCTVAVFVPGPWESTELQSRDAGGVPVHTKRLRLPFGADRPLRGFLGWCAELPRTLRDLRRICDSHRIDIIHIHTATNYGYIFRLLRLLGGPPYVVTFHRGDVVDFPSRGPVDRALIRWGLAGAAASNAVSSWLAAEAKRVFPGLCDPVCVYNGIALTAPVRRQAADAGTTLTCGSPYFIMVGTFDPYKGHDVAIRAWAELPAQGRPHLVIVGDGELRDSYLRLIAELGCGDWIHLTGQLPNAEVQKLVAGAMGMVFPSRNEGFGYVMLEAGLAEMPLICSRIPPLDEVVSDGETGLLVPPDDPKALAAAVSEVIADADRARRLGANLRRRVEQRFSADAMSAGYTELFARVRDQEHGR